MAQAKNKPKRVRNFDRRLWSRFWRTAKSYWFGDEKWAARGLLAVLVILLLGRTQFAVLFNEQTGEFTSALAAKDSGRFWGSMRVFGLALVGAVPIYALHYWVRDRLGLRWRRWMTHRFLGKYFSNRAFYELTSNDAIDNPDQRIADDINSFTYKSLRFLLEIVSAGLQLVAFSGVLWSISKELVAFLVFYAAFGSAMTFGLFGKPLIGLNFQQLRREADFRFGLIRVRENAEAIAFYRGEAREAEHVKGRFHEVLRNGQKLVDKTLFLNLFQYAYSFLALAVPSIIVAPRIISGELEVGRAIQAGGAFAAMLSALTVFVDNFESLSGFAAGVDRLHGFQKTLDDHGRPPAAGAPGRIERVQHPALELEAVTLQIPNSERTLARQLSLAVKEGEGLLIVGASGGGKSSLLRAIAGLWNSGSGLIRRPPAEQMLFLPQRPYMILGTLREQLLYPFTDRALSDAELSAVLDRVNLRDVVERCGGFDRELDFAKVLSLGEQQRLAIARVLLAQPRYVILDEATSALDSENEEHLYRALRAMNTTLVSVTHHPGLAKYHGQVLRLTGGGRWSLEEHSSVADRSERERPADRSGVHPRIERAPKSARARG
ncbi:MAG TPA: ABC transporter ATP-binding protein/permease [Polyangiaceae bacterium]|nr:ABC transporter ATP-binding protein/permease [Polyangiaceae bacterium]